MKAVINNILDFVHFFLFLTIFVIGFPIWAIWVLKENVDEWL